MYIKPVDTCNNRWQTLATLAVSGPNEEALACWLRRQLDELTLPPTQSERLITAVSEAMFAIQQTVQSHVMVYLYLQATGDWVLPTQPGWGFFLVEKRTQTPATTEPDAHQPCAQLDIYLYQESKGHE